MKQCLNIANKIIYTLILQNWYTDSYKMIEIKTLYYPECKGSNSNYPVCLCVCYHLISETTRFCYPDKV